jgi:DNA-binding MarR family transcriptional regulator
VDPLNRQVTCSTTTRLLGVAEIFRELDREVPAQVLAVYLYVASHNGCHSQAMMEDLELTGASASRNTDWLSKKHRLGKPGLNLIRKEVDESNKRRHTLWLTPKGKELLTQINQLLHDDRCLEKGISCYEVS